MRKFLALLFGLALFVPLAACGGGDDEDSSSSSGSASSADDEETTTTTEEEDEDDGGDSSEFCGVIDDIQDANFDELDFEDPEALAAALDALEELRDAAPGDLEEDMDQLIAGFEFLAENFDDLSDPEAAAELEEEFADEFEDFDAAGERVDEFSLEECGITVDGETADDSSGSGDDDDDAGSGGASDAELGDPESPPDATEDGLLGTSVSVDELDDLMADCEDGDLAACDEVFAVTSVGSPEEDYGSTCGGRLDIEDEVNGQCEVTFG
jgi:hypothetical protein